MALFYKSYKANLIEKYNKIKILYPLQVQKCNVNQIKLYKKKNSMDACKPGPFHISSGHRGSLTVEASLALPIMILALTSILFIMQLVGVWNHLGQAAADSIHRFSAIAESGGNGDVISIYPLFISQLDGSFLQQSGIEGGISGILVEPDMKEEDIVLEIKYDVNVPFGMFPLPSIRFNQRTIVKRWNGCQPTDHSIGTDGKIMAYVAENGAVYHKDRECTHLRLSIQGVGVSQIRFLRNKSGRRYYPCDFCGDKGCIEDIVYITDTGDRYHGNIGCSGLKRSVQTVAIDEVKDLPPCSRCGQDTKR